MLRGTKDSLRHISTKLIFRGTFTYSGENI
jgi:hypothetical protein